MKLIQIVAALCLGIFIISCSDNGKKPDKEFIEAIIVSKYQGMVSVSDLECRFSKIIKQDSIRFITVTFDATVFFNDTYMNQNPSTGKLDMNIAGTVKHIFDGVIRLIDTKGYWSVVDVKIK